VILTFPTERLVNNYLAIPKQITIYVISWTLTGLRVYPSVQVFRKCDCYLKTVLWMVLSKIAFYGRDVNHKYKYYLLSTVLESVNVIKKPIRFLQIVYLSGPPSL